MTWIVYAEAGNQCDVGITRTFEVTSEEGTLSINFPLVNGKPSTVAGIQVSGRNVDPPTFLYAGSGSSEYNGDGVHALSANINPSEIAVKSNGDVIFVDDRGSVRIIDATTELVSTLVSYPVNEPFQDEGTEVRAIALDAEEHVYYLIREYDGEVFIADRVKKIDKTTGEVSVVVGALYGEPIAVGDEIPALEIHLSEPLWD